MLAFRFFPSASRLTDLGLHGAYLVGPDGVPIRGAIALQGDVIRCQPSSSEPVGLSLMWPVTGFGTVQLETTRLCEREEPYNLHVELARQRLMRISLKREEWGLYDYRNMSELADEIDAARGLFIQSLQASGSDDESAATLADKALERSMIAGDQLSRFHADIFLARRQQSGAFQRGCFGATCRGAAKEPVAALRDLCSFVRVPFTWRDIQPREAQFQFVEADACVQAALDAGLAVRGGPLLNFGVQFVPDWMYSWEHDYDAITNFARQQVLETVRRYKGKIQHWVACSALSAESVFSFNFEQVIDLTRLATETVRQTVGRGGQVVIDLPQPWGEYHARNPRTVPPLLYAEMLAQAGVRYDALGVQFVFGIDSEGYRLRDMLQISGMIDRLANLGKPVHVTAVAVPAAPGAAAGGQWHDPWSEPMQAEWLVEFCQVVLSKPYVESVCFEAAADGPHAMIPTGGVLRADGDPKPAFEALRDLRRRLCATEA